MRLVLSILLASAYAFSQPIEPAVHVLSPPADPVELLRLTVENNRLLADKAKAEADKAAAELATAQDATAREKVKSVAANIDTLLIKTFGFLGIALTGIAIPLVSLWLKRKADEIAKSSAVVVQQLSDVNNAVADNTIKTLQAKEGILQIKRERQETAIAQDAALKQIHSLVNSNLTQSKVKELASDEANLVSLLEIIDMKRKTGIEPTHEALETVEGLRLNIAELKAELSDRKKQTDTAASQLKADIAKLPETPETPEKKKLEV